ncbi:MAG: ABC transporter permease subunit [Alphaproteobacteria bacterium]|nr:ABC transporter permease subunit [Alphaproteobacteria bacterium]
MKRGMSPINLTVLTLGFAFLYLPIFILIVFSFNESKLVNVWAGFSTKWYGEMAANDALIDAALVTLEVGLVSSTLATILGTMAAVLLTRFGRFRGRTLFAGMVLAPLVMPEVIIGLALLLMFLSLGLSRGTLTVVIAHATFAMAYVTVIVQSRLMSMDRAIEEAAQDLGCPPFRTFLNITLPIIAPAVIAGWLCAFTLSLDDLVIASFTTGPGATTLPMKIYSQVRLGVTPEINAISTLMIGVVTAGVIAASLINRRSHRRQGRADAPPRPA